VRLPLVAAPSPNGQPRAPEGPPPPRRILIVEDSQDARDMLRIYLAQSGHQVYEAADGPGAVEAALRARPEVALIDIGLPGLDGYEVVRRIRAAPEGQAMVLVALTGYGQPKDQRRAREAGFDAFLVKPFDRDRLSSVLAAARRRTSEEDET
jgi:CheY-like chemotaxis protein